MHYVLVIFFSVVGMNSEGVGVHVTSQQLGPYSTIESCNAAGKAVANFSGDHDYKLSGIRLYNHTTATAHYACLSVDGKLETKK